MASDSEELDGSLDVIVEDSRLSAAPQFNSLLEEEKAVGFSKSDF